MSPVVPDSMNSANKEVGMSDCLMLLLSTRGVGVEFLPRLNELGNPPPSV